MIRILKILLWLTIVAITALVWEGEGTAAPGDFLFQWGKPHILSRPAAVAVDSPGDMYTSEAEAGRVLVFDATAKSGARPST